MLDRFVREDRGQDLVEYALLAAIIAIAGLLVMPTISSKMGNEFRAWGTNVNNIVVPSNPKP